MVEKIKEKQIWLNEDLHHKLKVLSAQEGMTLKSFVNYLLEEFERGKARN